MSARDRDPLNPEERALAARLQRAGAAEAPPAALDARILAAAREAARHPPRASRRPRLAAWLPGGAITVVGTAAAFVIAIGTAWQLRPVERPSASAPQADDGVVAVELLGPRATHPDTAAGPAPDSAAAVRGPAEQSRNAGPAPRAEAAREITGPRASDPAAVADAPAPAQTGADPRPPATSVADASATFAAPAAADATPLPPSADVAPGAASSNAEAAAAAGTSLSEPTVPGVERPRRATYTTAARARAATHDDRAASPRRAEDRSTVLAEIPIDADAELAPAAWLERIRARRDAGDVDGARESLRRFVIANPRLRVPPDLRHPGP